MRKAGIELAAEHARAGFSRAKNSGIQSGNEPRLGLAAAGVCLRGAVNRRGNDRRMLVEDAVDKLLSAFASIAPSAEGVKPQPPSSENIRRHIKLAIRALIFD
jgi:hypothetical protein